MLTVPTYICLTFLIITPFVYLIIKGFINNHGVTRSVLAQNAPHLCRLSLPSSGFARKTTGVRRAANPTSFDRAVDS